MKPKYWAIVSVFIGLAVFAVLVLAFYNFGYVERACSNNQEVQRRLFDSNTITFMSSFILVVMFSLFFSTQDRLESQSRAYEKQTELINQEKETLLSSMKHTQKVNTLSLEAQAICDKCILLLSIMEISSIGTSISPNKPIRSLFSECYNGISDLEQRLKSLESPLSTSDKHIVFSPLVSAFHKCQAFQRLYTKNMDPVLVIYIQDLMQSFNEIGVS